MPLCTEILDGIERTPRQVRWGFWHVNCMFTAALKEGDPDWEYQDGKRIDDLDDGIIVDFSWTPIYYLQSKAPLIKRGEQTLLQRHEFTDPSDGEVLVFESGTVLRAWRD